jgi:hypothetical protein
MSWFNVQGSPVDSRGQNAKLMDENPEVGSTWKGRILMDFACESCLLPEMKLQPVESATIEKAIKNKLLDYETGYEY